MHTVSWVRKSGSDSGGSTSHPSPPTRAGASAEWPSGLAGLNRALWGLSSAMVLGPSPHLRWFSFLLFLSPPPTCLAPALIWLECLALAGHLSPCRLSKYPHATSSRRDNLSSWSSNLVVGFPQRECSRKREVKLASLIRPGLETDSASLLPYALRKSSHRAT